MMEKICAEMYCSALGSTDVEFYVERGTSDEFIMQKIYDILDLDITYKRECLDGPLFVIRSTETNEYLERCMYFEKTPKWTIKDAVQVFLRQERRQWNILNTI